MATCVNCGGDLPRNARFCPGCGAPRAPGESPPPARRGRTAETVELCAIEWWRGYVRSDFCAIVIDTDGRQREIARSPRFSWWRSNPPPAHHAEARAAHDALVAELVERGWKSTGSDSHPWYAFRFRRPTALRALTDSPPPSDVHGDKAEPRPGSGTVPP